jgi:hypothetical protein
MTDTPKYLVIWRGDEDEFMQSEVDIGILDPHQMSNNEWAHAAALSEGYSRADADQLVNGTGNGYELILACPMPSAFYEK